MHNRRELMLSGAAAAAASAIAGPAAAQRYVELNALSFADLDGRAIRSVMTKSEKIAVLGYRLGIITRSGISASTGQGNVSMDASVELRGVSMEMARAIADDAYADLMTQLAATGRPMATLDEVRATEGYRRLQATQIPFIKKPFADARQAAIVAPNGQELFFQHSDSPLTDKAPAALSNWRAINQMSVDLGNAIILTPVVVVDFAELSGSGHKVYGNAANVAVKPGVYVVEVFSGLGANQAKIALAGDGGRALLQKRVAVGQAGEFIRTSTYGNRAEVEWWNSIAPYATSNVGRPSTAYESSSYVYQVNPTAFHDVVVDGAKGMNRAFAEAVSSLRPR